ncbi:MAG: tetratricopeptide repeat protein [Promethearchaeota archaeon]|nr:MAG: tetratricopeptide repeat protein [Candidatus Lokiarchaeota archaeon]
MKKVKQSQQLENIDKLILKCLTLLKAREFDQALSIVNNILNEKSTQMNLIQKFGARITRLVALMALKKFKAANEEIKLSEQIINQMDNDNKENSLVKDGIGRLFSIKGAIQSAQGELEDAIVNYHHSLEIYETLNKKKSIFYQLDAIGWIKRAQGKLDEALKYFHKMLSLAEEIHEERYIAQAKFAIAFANFYKGDLDQATEQAQECLVLYEKLKHFRGLAAVYSIFGSIYRGRGEFDKSLEYYRKVLTIFNENLGIQQGVTHSYCYALRNIGWIYYYRNKIKKSIEYLREAVKAHKSLCESNNSIFDYDLIIFNLFLTLFAIEIDDFRQIEDSMEELSKFALKWPWADFFLKLGKAIILKNKQRAKYRFQAQQILEEIKDQKFDFQLEFEIQVNLCDSLLEELKYSGEEEILMEIQDLLNRISDVANKQRSITTLVTLYSLQSKLALIEGNAELSRKLLTKALKIAENKGLELLSKKLTAQQNQLFNQLEEWRALFIRNSKLQERIEFLNLKRYVTKAINEVLEKKFTPQTVEEKVTVHKEKKSCLVCKGEVERFNIYICPKCNSIYCNNCAQTLTTLENACWVCNAPIDSLKPIIPIQDHRKESKVKTLEKPKNPLKEDKNFSSN